jgi:hypothetical protein
MTVQSEHVREGLIAYLAEDIEAVDVQRDGGAVACSTPLEYPDGDGATVWVSPDGGGPIEVSDYGRGFRYLLAHPPQDHAALRQHAARIAHGQGVDFADGRLSFWLRDYKELAESIWRVAYASVQVAQVGVLFRPRRKQRENEFERTVEHLLATRNIMVRRDEEVIGASGHRHRATFYLPRVEALLEPVSGSGHFSQVSAVYTKFGDVAEERNGHRLFTLVDDRETALQHDVSIMLSQVSQVVRWSRQDEWLPRFLRPSFRPT